MNLSPLPPDIPVTCHGFSLLGWPIGPSDFCEEVFQARLSKVKASSLGALTDMGDSQLEISLLRSCLTLPKVSYILCACPPNHICRSTADFDKAILVSVLGRPLSDWSWLKACLPSSRGGLNLCSASLHAPAAFLSSCSAAVPLVERTLSWSYSPHWLCGDGPCYCGCPS